MEQLVLGIFQDHLAKVIVGFKKEQINANLLNGKGEIRDVSLNCALLNESIARLTPYIRFDEIQCDRIGILVTSWANLRKAPIIVDIGKVTAKIHEPFSLLPRNQRVRIELITEAELKKKIADGLKLFRTGAYGLADRIVDNLTINIESFRLEFQTWGKLKTRRLGPWTPPLIQVECNDLKVCMVDDDGNVPQNPDQAWHHNQGRRDHFMIHQKVQGECKVKLVPHHGSENFVSNEYLPDELAKMKFEVQLAVLRRIRDGAILGVQVDVTVPKVDVDIDSKSMRSIAHLLSGLQYCLAKDKSFEDPLRSKAENEKRVRPSSAIVLVKKSESRIASQGKLSVVENEIEKSCNDIINERKNSATGGFDGDSPNDDRSASSLKSDNGDEDTSVTSDCSSVHGIDTSKLRKPKSADEQPIILLPNGIIIHRSVTVTCSVTDLSLWGSYDDEKGCVELITKGCIAEFIWPKSSREQGMYAQLSTSFISLQERFGERKRTLLLGGIQRGDHLSLNLPSRKSQEIIADESFPLFERRGIRDDPLDLRHLFPTQAFGLKMTLEESDSSSTVDTFTVLHEIGVDEIDIVLDTDVIFRVVSFFLGDCGNGFDPRWHTGDWTDILTPEMLRRSSETLQLDNYIQEQKQVFLDENYMISSDLFNVTARFSNVELRIPASIEDSLRACDIVLKWKETTFAVSSALPRTILTGKIGNSISGDARNDEEKDIIDFPNDPSDICYRCEQRSEQESVSTFKMQLTTRGFEMKTIPAIQLCMAVEAQNSITISNLTMIICFEGEPPLDGGKKIKINLFFSILIHELKMNIDFELITGAICTLVYHRDNLDDIVDKLISVLSAPSVDTAESSSSEEVPVLIEPDKIQQNMKGRRIMVRRHINQSRETGGLAVIFCLQQKEFELRIWRQNVPTTNHFCDGLESSHSTDYQNNNEDFMDLLILVECEMRDLEIGIEFDFHSNSAHRTVLKSFVQKVKLNAINLAKEIETNNHLSEHRSSQQGVGQNDFSNRKWNLVELCSFGNESMHFGLNPSGLAQQFAFRLEGQHKEISQSWSLAADMTSPSIINFDTEVVKNSILLIMEALFLPSWSKYPTNSSCSCTFPSGTIGAMIFWAVADVIQLDFSSLEIDKDSRDPILERVLRSVCTLLLPSNLNVILMRVDVANILITIPFNANDKDEQNTRLSFLLNRSDIITRFYPASGIPPSADIEKVLACKGINWSSLINTDEGGFYLYIVSKQTLLSVAEEPEMTKPEMVVNPFEISITYSGATMNISMNNGISFDVKLIEDFQSKFRAAVLRTSKCLHEIFDVIGAINLRTEAELHAGKMHSNSSENSKEIEGKALQIDCSSFLNTQKFLLKIHDAFLLYDKNVRKNLELRDMELELMKTKMFLKERERIGVLSLLASRLAGWIRIGEQQLSGQRVLRKSLFWPYWMVIRKELLLIYPRPGCPKPFDVVSLINAKMQKITDSNSRHEIKKGFAIIESSGLTRYFIADNTQEYKLWKKEITSAIVLFSDSISSSDLASTVDGTAPASAIIENGNENCTDSADQESKRIGNRLVSAFQSASSRLSESSDLSRLSEFGNNSSLRLSSNVVDKGIFDENDRTHITYSKDLNFKDSMTNKGDEIRKKISGVGLVTKNRLGSALQNRRQRRDLQISSANSSTKNESVEEHGSLGSRTELQIGNKIGSAFQNARIKAKENLEKQGRLSNLRGKLSGLSQPLGDDLSKVHNNPISTSINDHTVEFTWQCEACTFINKVEKNPDNKDFCDMCGNERSFIHTPPTNSTSSISIKAPQSQLCSRVESKVAFKSEENNPRISRFSFRKRQEESLANSIPLTLKNIFVSHETLICPTEFVNEEPQLKILRGEWTVRVTEISHAESQTYINGEELRDSIIKGTDTNCGPTKGKNNEETVTTSTTLELERNNQVPGILQTSLEDDDAVSQVLEAEGEIQLPASIKDMGLSYTKGADEYNFVETKSSMPVFLVKAVRAQDESLAEKQWTIGDVVKLYYQLSEVLEPVLPQLTNKYRILCKESSSEMLLNFDVCEKMIVFGRLLGGLLDYEESSDRVECLRNYQCQCIEGFFNSLLSCPLSAEALKLLCEELGIDGITEDVKLESRDDSSKSSVHEFNEEKPKDVPSLLKHPGTILSLLTQCEAEFQQLVIKGIPYVEIAEKSVPLCSFKTKKMFHEPFISSSVNDHIHKSIRISMMNTLAERDEAHAHLIGANVMHIHSLERERKKNERMEIDATLRQRIAKLQLEEDMMHPNIANFFGRPDDKITRMRNQIFSEIDKVRQLIRSDDGEAEMAQLCHQLAAEISTKTSYALEIERMKQNVETEKQIQAAEKKSMEDELKRLKDLLAKERSKNAELLKKLGN